MRCAASRAQCCCRRGLTGLSDVVFERRARPRWSRAGSDRKSLGTGRQRISTGLTAGLKSVSAPSTGS